MKIKLFAILLFLTGSLVVKAQNLEYLDSNGAANCINTYGAPSVNYEYVDYCVLLENTWGSWYGQFDRSYIINEGATGISFVVRIEEFYDNAIIYEWGSNGWVPKAFLHGTSDQYYATYNITSGYYGPALVRIIKNSIDDYSDGWNEYDFHYIRGMWWNSF